MIRCYSQSPLYLLQKILLIDLDDVCSGCLFISLAFSFAIKLP